MTRLAQLGLVLILLTSGCEPSFTATDAHTRLVFKVGEPGAPVDPNELERVQSVVERRLQSTEAVWQFIVESHEPDELIVLSRPLTDEQVADVKDILTRPGTLEFAILANTRDHAELIAAAQATDVAANPNEPPQYAWIPVGTDTDGQHIVLSNYGSIVVRETDQDGEPLKEVLVVLETPNGRVTDKLLKNAYQDSSASGTPTLGFELNTRGAYLMNRLTSESLPASDGFKRRLGVILEGTLHSAPTINVAVQGRGILQGDFTATEIDRIASSLNGGSLPAQVRFVEVHHLGAE